MLYTNSNIDLSIIMATNSHWYYMYYSCFRENVMFLIYFVSNTNLDKHNVNVNILRTEIQNVSKITQENRLLSYWIPCKGMI